VALSGQFISGLGSTAVARTSLGTMQVMGLSIQLCLLQRRKHHHTDCLFLGGRDYGVRQPAYDYRDSVRPLEPRGNCDCPFYRSNLTDP
jgi:hypothetical protein